MTLQVLCLTLLGLTAEGVKLIATSAYMTEANEEGIVANTPNTVVSDFEEVSLADLVAQYNDMEGGIGDAVEEELGDLHPVDHDEVAEFNPTMWSEAVIEGEGSDPLEGSRSTKVTAKESTKLRTQASKALEVAALKHLASYGKNQRVAVPDPSR